MTNSNKPIAVALVGAGYIADYHYAALRPLPNVEVRAICDLNQRLAEQYAQGKGIPNIYGDLGKRLSKEKLDTVHVLTPPHLHFQNGCQIVEAGVDAFIEKPFCHTVANCQDLRERAEATGRSIGVTTISSITQSMSAWLPTSAMEGWVTLIKWMWFGTRN